MAVIHGAIPAALGGSGGAALVTDLDDAPSTYAGAAGKVLAVNAGADGIEFVAAGDVVLSGLTPGASLIGAPGGTIGETTTLTYDPVGHTWTLTGLPTEDPEIENQLWNDEGVLSISLGAP